MLVAKVGNVAPGMCVCATNPFPATGVVISGAAQFTTTGIPVVVGGVSIVQYPCGTSVIVSPSISLMTNGMPVSKMGDVVQGCGNGTLVAETTITSL